MIPTIETIVEDLAAGKITKQQAVAWLHAHAEGAANDLRDHFAGLAMQALVQSWQGGTEQDIALTAYSYADAMLKGSRAHG